MMKHLRFVLVLVVLATPIDARAAITFVGSAADDGNASTSTATTAAFDSSSCTPNCLLLAHVTYYNTGAATITVSDSKGSCGTWTALTETGSANYRERWYYCFTSTVGTGHTVQAAFGLTLFPCIGVMYFSGVASFDAESAGGTTNSNTTLQGGSITPSANNALVVSGLSWSATGGAAVNGGFTKVQEQQEAAGNSVPNVMGYLIQTSAAAANPTWTFTSGEAAARNASFLATGGAGATPCFRSLLGVGCDALRVH